MAAQEIKLLTEFYHLDEYRYLKGYEAKNGYKILAKALAILLYLYYAINK